MRVPFLIRWPGNIPAGRVSGELATVMDFLPTIAGIVGAELPKGRIIHGYDIWPILSGDPVPAQVTNPTHKQNVDSVKKKVDAVIFDMDGLMIDTEPIYIFALQRAAEEMGYPVEDRFFFQLVGLPDPACRGKIAAHFGPDFPLDTYWERWPQIWQSQAETRGIAQKRGLSDLLSFLRQKDIPTAIATSSSRRQADFCLKAAGVLHPFEHVITHDDITRGKPAPDIYLKASRKLGADPGNCIALEDSETGVMSAHSAGMITIMVPDLSQPSEKVRSFAYEVMESLTDVHQHFRSGNHFRFRT